jgi:site-specific recombinase XerD
MCKEQLKCTELTQKILAIMREDGYSESVVKSRLKHIYNKLAIFCDEHNEGWYSPEIGNAFLDENEGLISDRHFLTHKAAIERIDRALCGDFHYRPISKKDIPYVSSSFDEQLTFYEKQLYESGKTKRDVRNRMHVLARFMKYAQDHGCHKLADIDARIIYGGFEVEGSKDEFRKTVAHFLRYAYRQELLPMDISSFVPEFSRHQPIPTVYSIKEINTILESIDRTKRLGKRNYAVIMIAARTGLRSCDIADLKFDNIDRKNKILTLVQKKTGEYIEMPLLDEVLEAIDDYVLNERPASSSANIFLSHKNPDVTVLFPRTIYVIVSRTIKRSGIDPAGRKCGAHALRSSLASHLLEEGNSYSIIQKVLGHTSPEAAKHYVKVELTKLRECALGVPVFPADVEKVILQEVLR